MKQETREGRSKGDVLRTLVHHDAPIQQSKFQKILRVNEYKTKLFELIADCVVAQFTEPAVIATKGDNVVSNKGIHSTGLQPCNHKKADIRILLHARNAVLSEFKKVMIVANDTDVVVVSLYAFFDLRIDKLWIEYGSGKHQCWLPIHTYASVLGEARG